MDSPTDTSERGLEDLIVAAMTASAVADRYHVRPDLRPAGKWYRRRRSIAGVNVQLAGNEMVWWLWVDSNHRPQHYECCALTG